MIADDDWVSEVHPKYTIDCVLGANTLKNHPYCAFQAMNCANILILLKAPFLWFSSTKFAFWNDRIVSRVHLLTVGAHLILTVARVRLHKAGRVSIYVGDSECLLWCTGLHTLYRTLWNCTKSVYGRIVGTFFQPVRRMAMMIDMWMYTSNIGAIFSVTILPSKDFRSLSLSNIVLPIQSDFLVIIPQLETRKQGGQT